MTESKAPVFYSSKSFQHVTVSFPPSLTWVPQGLLYLCDHHQWREFFLKKREKKGKNPMNSRFLALPWRCLSCAGTGAERAQSWHLALVGAASLPSLSSAWRKLKVIKSSSAAPFFSPALPTAPPDPELGTVGIHPPADPAGTEPNPSLARNPSWNCWLWQVQGRTVGINHRAGCGGEDSGTGWKFWAEILRARPGQGLRLNFGINPFYLSAKAPELQLWDRKSLQSLLLCMEPSAPQKSLHAPKERHFLSFPSRMFNTN